MEFRKANIELAFDLKRIQVLSHLDWEIVPAMGMGGSASINMGGVGGNWLLLVIIINHLHSDHLSNRFIRDIS
ncbi:hypothetical protein C476_16620 [Natrinema limicola JCM 13563]|uniref:Uncharacterized protein n=1 Tax=Natrinema limicola JCM 13563 TaxID=1230457 RepID=M0C4X5_9EURY|nr:hypothetical protein C476_16620 [Natrinema limicola JCM 13563]